MNNNCIRNVQYNHLIDMLNFNLPSDFPDKPVWKLFIMDSLAQRIISPLLKVNDLREHGVTLFLQLKSQREIVPEVPAVYFVEPCRESIGLICQDLKNNLYGSFYLNFTSQISRDLLEELAQVALQTQTHLKIAKVYDQFLNYVSLEDSLFTLDIEKCLSRVLGAKDGLEGIVDRSVSGLFSVLMSFGGNAPIICLKEDEAGDSLVKNICSKLESRIKSHLINTKSPLSLDSSHTSSTSNAHQSRPLLLVLDRRVDLAAPLKHSSTYNALIDEILGLDANRVQIGSKSFDIDRRDWFWRENSNKSFPKVAEAVEVALKTYKQEYDRVLQTTPGMTEDLMRANGNSAIEASIESSLTPDQLKVAINVLPELTERKRLIDTHLQICTALLESLKSRDLGTLFNIEQEMISSSTSTGQATTASMTTAAWNSLLSTLKDAKIGNSQDKLRLLLIHILYNQGASSQNGRFIQEALDVLKPTGSDLKAFQFVTQRLLEEDANLATNEFDFENKTLKTSNSSSKATSPGPLDQNSFAFGDFFTKLSTTTGNLVSSVKNLMPSGSGISESPLTRLIDSAYASAIVNTAPQLQQQLKFLDPRPVSSKSASSVSSSSFSIDHIILFVLGGAAYAEYDHLLEHFERSKNLQNLKFTLGVSEVLNPKKYLNQLSEMNLNQ